MCRINLIQHHNTLKHSVSPITMSVVYRKIPGTGSLTRNAVSVGAALGDVEINTRSGKVTVYGSIGYEFIIKA